MGAKKLVKWGFLISTVLMLWSFPVNANDLSTPHPQGKPYLLKDLVEAVRKIAASEDDFSPNSTSMEFAKSVSAFIAGPQMTLRQANQLFKFSYNFSFVAEEDKTSDKKRICNEVEVDLIQQQINLLCWPSKATTFSKIEKILGKPVKIHRGPYPEAHGMVNPSADFIISESFEERGISYSAEGSDNGDVSRIKISLLTKFNRGATK